MSDELREAVETDPYEFLYERYDQTDYSYLKQNIDQEDED